MTRYLTPQKISLLVLVSLYCDSVVPNSVIVPVLSFVVSCLIPSHPRSSDDAATASVQIAAMSLEEFEAVMSVHPSAVPGRTLFDLFLQRLWAINNLASLHAFFESLEGLLARTREELRKEMEAGITTSNDRIYLSRTSPLGTFVRRAQLEFTRLQFHDSFKIWTCFIKYRQSTEPQWREKQPLSSPMSFDSNVQDLALVPGDKLFDIIYGRIDDADMAEELMSTDEIERLLEFQVERLQKFGNRVPDNMKAQLQKMLTPSATVPSLLHFVSFFDAWRAGDYMSSFDNLHRYFDYTMQARDKSYYQYALLHMAILQADFGCFTEAVAAMNETIATARENQDMSCLNFSLSWLNHLGKAFPKQMKGAGCRGILGSERDGLMFLKTKAKESRMWSLLSTTLLNEAKLDLSHGENIPRALELIYQSSYLNTAHNICSNFGAQLLMESSCFERLGIGHMASVSCQLLLQCYRPDSPTEEILRAVCRSASMAAQEGHYDYAIKCLKGVETDSCRILKLHQYVIAYSDLIKMKQALHRSDIAAAEHVLARLRVGAAADPEIDLQVSLLEVDYLMSIGSFSAVSTKIQAMLDELDGGEFDISHRIHLLSLKAALFAKSGQPQKGFSIAIRAASTAQRAKVFPALWEAIASLSRILIVLEQFDAARRLLDSIIPQTCEGANRGLCALLYSLQTDAYMGMARVHGDPQSQRSAYLISHAALYLERALACYIRIEDVRGKCEMLAKKVVVSRLRNDGDSARDSVTRYLDTYTRATEHSIVSGAAFA